MRRLSRCIEVKCACMLKSRTPSHCHFTSISAIFLRLWDCVVFIWARAMETSHNINSMQHRTFNTTGNYSTQATPITSGLLTNLLWGPLGDTCYSDTSSNRYLHTQSGLGSDDYMNKCNSALETQPELSLPSPLLSPFDPLRESTPLHPVTHTHNTSGSIAMHTQVSALTTYR